MNFNEQAFLCHHGILGMKWGIRRYQNPDGSLTSAGRARYKHDIQKYMGYKSEKYRDKLMKKVPSALKKLNKKNGKKEVTTEELNEAYKAIKNASNSEIAEQLMIKKKKGVEGAIIGASKGVVEATIFALMGKNFTKVLKTSVSELGFDADALGVEIKQDPKLLAKSYARKTTVSAAEGYLLSQIGKDKQAALNIITASNKRISHSSFLAHYGIKGMKWGVRRYQNPDGSLTKLGLQRYGSSHNLKKVVRKEMRTAERNSNDVIMRRYAVEGANRIAKNAEEKYAKTQKEKHRIRAEAARQNVEYQKQKVAEAEKTRREHYNHLVKEFGKTAIEKISYTDDERTKIAHDAQVAALWSVGVTVPSMQQMGYDRASVDYGAIKHKLKKAQKQEG